MSGRRSISWLCTFHFWRKSRKKAFWGEHQTLCFSYKMSVRSRKVSSPNGRVLADEFMTNARVGRTRIGVDASCDVRWDDAVSLPTICDLMDFSHPTLLLEPQYACCSEPHGLRQHLQETGLGAVDINITRTRDKTDCYKF